MTAWGYPLGATVGKSPTLTKGIISSAVRIFEDTEYVQTDAAVEPGEQRWTSDRPLRTRPSASTPSGLSTKWAKMTIPTAPGLNFSVASNEISDRLATYEAGGPEQATYQNLRYDYGYSMDVPKGWYLIGEGGERLTSQYTAFSAYGGERVADILTLKLLRQYSDRSDALVTVAGAYWAVLLPIFAEDWHFFEPISVPEFTIMGGQPFFRMAYRYQTDEEECILSGSCSSQRFLQLPPISVTGSLRPTQFARTFWPSTVPSAKRCSTASGLNASAVAAATDRIRPFAPVVRCHRAANPLRTPAAPIGNRCKKG